MGGVLLVTLLLVSCQAPPNTSQSRIEKDRIESEKENPDG